MSSIPETDEALLAAALQGKQSALERLLLRHEPLLRLAVRSVLARANAAKDKDLEDEGLARSQAELCANDLRVLRSFGGRSRLGTFLAVIARRAAARLLEERRPRSERANLEIDDGAGQVASEEEAPEERAAHEEERTIIAKAIDALPERQALALRLFYVSGLGHKEIGQALGVPTTSVGQILARAREKLRNPLSRAGLGEGRQGGDEGGISGAPGAHHSGQVLCDEKPK